MGESSSNHDKPMPTAERLQILPKTLKQLGKEDTATNPNQSNKLELLPTTLDMIEQLAATPQTTTSDSETTTQTETETLQPLNLKNPSHRIYCAEQIASGKPILIQMPTLGIMANASTPEHVADMFAIKGTPREQIKQGTLAIDDLFQISKHVDLARLDPRLHKYFDIATNEYPENKAELARRIGGIAIVRVPIKSMKANINGAQLHERVVSTDEDGNLWAQFLYFGDYNQDAQTLIRAANERSRMTVLTSLNITGQPTVTKLEEALRLAKSLGIETAITDPSVQLEHDTRTASYPIIVMGPNGIEIARSEHMNLETEIVMSLWPEIFPDSQLPEYIQGVPQEILRLVLARPDQAKKIMGLYTSLKTNSAQIEQAVDQMDQVADKLVQAS